MPKKLTEQEKKRRAILIRMMLDLNAAVSALPDRREVCMSMLAARLGVYQGKPMDVSALAALVDLPRATATRHIRALEAAGRVTTEMEGRRLVVRPSNGESDHGGRLYRRIKHTARTTIHDLSRMDSLTFDIHAG